MSIFTATRFAMGLCLVTSLTACSKSSDKPGDDKAAVATDGCGKDYGDPAKQFCVTLPDGYKAQPKIDKDELYSELVRFDGPAMGDGMAISIGTSNSNFKTYQDEVDGEERLLKLGGRKLESSGATSGNQGKWWLYNYSGYRIIEAIAKAPNGKAIMCKPSNTTPSPAAYEVCKTIRPFPTKS